MYKAKLSWILDKRKHTLASGEEEYRQNIDFVHSLGLKCDPVGWCDLDLTSPRTAEILDKIEAFCKKEHWHARGWYTLEYIDEDPLWYALKGTDFKERTIISRQEVPCIGGKTEEFPVLSAYHENSAAPKNCGKLYVPARFRDACEALGVRNTAFCWLQDKGRYAAEQYFAIYPAQTLAHIGCDHKIHCGKHKDIPKMGNHLPRIAKLFYDLTVVLPECYYQNDMPSGGVIDGIAIAHYRSKDEYIYQILIHRELAQALMARKAISPSHLIPVELVDAMPPGYTCRTSTRLPPPTDAFLAKNQAEYEAFRKEPRPPRRVTEKEALSSFRRAKRACKENFGKPLPKAQAEALTGTPYAPLCPYYAISDGGCLSDEYSLASYTEALAESMEFFAALAKEELLEEKPCGTVIGHTANGDAILLCTNGKVIRFGHEEPIPCEEWATLAQFIFEAVTNTE